MPLKSPSAVDRSATTRGRTRLGRGAVVGTALPAMVLGASAAQAQEPAAGTTVVPDRTHVPAPARTSAATPALTHTVVAGDTLSEIAWSRGIPVGEVFALNDAGWDTVIHPGQTVVLRAATAAAPAAPAAGERTASTPEAATTYTVRPGDGWWRIGQRTGLSMRHLQEVNGMSASTMLHPDMVLDLVAPTRTATAPPAGAEGSEVERTAEVAPVAGAVQRYTVQNGDSLWLIGHRHEISVQRLRELNGLAVGAMLHPGQVLVLSDPARQPAASTAPREIGNTFLHYTYPQHVTDAANENLRLIRQTPAPSPAQMQQIIRETAQRMGVDPRLALAHAQTESHFRHHSVSPANALGAMQVIPTTGEFASQLVGRELNLLDPYDNATAGIAYIRYIQARTPSVDLGIGAYYQGLGGVLRDGLRPDTQTYVAKVRAAMALY